MKHGLIVSIKLVLYEMIRSVILLMLLMVGIFTHENTIKI